MFKGHRRLIESIAREITVGTVADLQEISPFSAACRNLKISHHISGYPVVVEAGDHISGPERDLPGHQLFHRAAAAGIGPEENRHFSVRHSLRGSLPDICGQLRRLLSHMAEQTEFHRTAVFPVRPDFFWKPLFILNDQPSCAFQDLGSAPVIRFQSHHSRRRIVFRKTQHDFRIGAPEPVDRLVIIAHNKQVMLRLSQHFHDIILQRADVLKFINQKILKLLLPQLQDVRPPGEQPVAPDHDIIEIQLFIFLHPQLVFPVYVPKYFLGQDSGIEMGNIHPGTLDRTDLPADGGRKICFTLRPAVAMTGNFPQKLVLLFFTYDILPGNMICMTENPVEYTMKGAKSRLRGRNAHWRQKSPLHFSGCRPSERHHQN